MLGSNSFWIFKTGNLQHHTHNGFDYFPFNLYNGMQEIITIFFLFFSCIISVLIVYLCRYSIWNPLRNRYVCFSQEIRLPRYKKVEYPLQCILTNGITFSKKHVNIKSTIRASKWCLNLRMKQNVYIVFVVILAVRGVLISDFMFRNPTNDNRVTLSTNIISTLILGSPMRCASHCTRNDECKSIMFNTDTHVCQLLSVHMTDTGPQTDTGWLYYEKKIGRSFFSWIVFFYQKQFQIIKKI